MTPSTARLVALREALLRSLLPCAALLLLAALLAGAAQAPLGDLVRDATVTGGLAPYAGGLSAVGVGLWTSSAAVALVATVGRPWADRRFGGLLLVVGLLSLALALDDQFRLHEDLLPRVGVPEELTYLGYALTVGGAGWSARTALQVRPDTVVLVVAVGLLGASVGVDLAQGVLDGLLPGTDARIYVEDGLKLCGAAVLLRWVVLVSRDAPAGGHAPGLPSAPAAAAVEHR